MARVANFVREHPEVRSQDVPRLTAVVQGLDPDTQAHLSVSALYYQPSGANQHRTPEEQKIADEDDTIADLETRLRKSTEDFNRLSRPLSEVVVDNLRFLVYAEEGTPVIVVSEHYAFPQITDVLRAVHPGAIVLTPAEFQARVQTPKTPQPSPVRKPVGE